MKMMMNSVTLLLLFVHTVHGMCAIRVYGPDGECPPGTQIACIDSRCARRCDCVPCPSYQVSTIPLPECTPGTRLTCVDGNNCVQDCRCEPFPYANYEGYFTITENDIDDMYFNVTTLQYYALMLDRQPLTPGFIDATHLVDPDKDVDGLRGMYRFDHADVGSPRFDIPLTQTGHVLFALATLVVRDRIEYHREEIVTYAPCRYTYSLAGVAASMLVRDMLVDASRGSLVSHTVTMVSSAHQSVILSIPGTTRVDEIVIISAHIDTRNIPWGGVDNVNGAAGMAAAMEACLAILDGGEQPLRTVECHFYAGHYVGYTGSSRIAELYSDGGKQVVGIYNLDGIASNNTDGYVYLMDSWPDMTDSVATNFVASLMNAYAPSLVPVRIACGFACSDHTSWGRMGYPVASVTNTLDTDVVVVVDGDVIFEHAKVATAFAIELGFKY